MENSEAMRFIYFFQASQPFQMCLKIETMFWTKNLFLQLFWLPQQDFHSLVGENVKNISQL